MTASSDDPVEELWVRCRLDRRGAEALFLELRDRVRRLGLDIELVSVGRPASKATPSQPDK